MNSFQSQSNRRTAAVLSNLLGAVALIGVILLTAWYFLPSQQVATEEMPLLADVVRGLFEHVVLEQGEVESSNSVEIRCEVKSRGGGSSTTILDVISEGTLVKDGDWLVTLDSSTLEEERGRQKIMVNTSEAIMIQAEAVSETSKIARIEYLKGTFVQEEKTLLNEIYVAEDALKKSQLELQSARRLLAKGLLTDLQLEAQRFSVAKARNELDAAKTRLMVLRDYTKIKMVTELNSDIKAAEVKWLNEQDSHAEEVGKLAEIEAQIKKCRIVAPQAGVVVYANIQSGRSNEFIVEPGTPVREQQVIVRLPDPNHMQVKAKINEARVNLVRPGQAVTIRIDALGDQQLRGEVVKVNKYAEPGHWWRSTSKEYATYIHILDPPIGILTGLTAEARIHVERNESALQLPIQSVYEMGGRTFCLVQDGSRWTTREISVLSTNGKTVAINEQRSDTLQTGEKVVANARRHANKFTIPEVERSVIDERLANVGRVVETGEPSENDNSGDEVSGEKSSGRSAAMRSPRDMIQRLDQDHDGKLSSAELAELPEPIRGGLAQADTNADGMIDQSEITKAMARFPQRQNTDP